MSDPRPAGLDLARIALRAAKEDARRRGNRPTEKRQRAGGRRMAGHGSDREPKPMGIVIPGLVTARGWEQPATGGTVMDRWAGAVGPDKAAHWTAEHYDPATRTLTVRADSPAWAATLRLSIPAVLAAVNAAAGADAVERLAVRTGPSRAAPIPGPAPERLAGSTPAKPTDAEAAEARAKYRASLPAAYRSYRDTCPPPPEPAPPPPNPFLPPEFGRLGREPGDALPDVVHALEKEAARSATRTRDGIPLAAIARARAERAARRKT